MRRWRRDAEWTHWMCCLDEEGGDGLAVSNKQLYRIMKLEVIGLRLWGRPKKSWRKVVETDK